MAATLLGRPRLERPAAIFVRHWAILWPGLLQKKHITAPVPLKLLLPGPRGFIRNLYCGRPFLFRIAFTSRSWAASSSSTSPTSSGSFSASEAAMLVTLYPLSLRRSLMMLSICFLSPWLALLIRPAPWVLPPEPWSGYLLGGLQGKPC